MKIAEKLAALRQLMTEKGIDAYIVPSSDPHGSEYPVDHWKSRAWVSTFKGSAGTVVVTADKAGLWTDGRYHTFAEELLKDTPIDLFKDRLPGVPTINDWLNETLAENSTVGFDGRLFSTTAVKAMQKKFEDKKISLISEFDLFQQIWTGRPELPLEENFDHDVKYTGKTRNAKLNELRAKMAEQKANVHILTTLDDIAWLYNIRLRNAMPAFGQAFSVVTEKEAHLFIAEKNITDVKEKLVDDGITLHPYEDAENFIAALPKDASVLLDPAKLNWSLYHAIPAKCAKVETANPTNLMKSIKNEAEIANSRNAHVKDGVAMVKFIHWMYQNLGEIKITECSAADKLAEFRWEQPDSFGPSFTTIPGYKDHAAQMHYSAEPATAYELEQEGFFLVDSGGQFLDGLTDTTRTFALGPVSEEQKRHYTLVLKGVIALSQAKFMKGTRGCNLDILARQPLWNEGIEYRCGTGHGVGYFLNVHEGPQNFSQGLTDVPIELGMMTTIEPGCYLEGRYGIRIENIVLTVKDKETEFGEFYKFEYLTLCPIDTTPVIKELLTAEEVAYLNDYHQTVYEKLSPLLTAEESEWLKNATAAI